MTGLTCTNPAPIDTKYFYRADVNDDCLISLDDLVALLGNFGLSSAHSMHAVYLWDAENRLSEVIPSAPSPSAKRVKFRYDYMSRRVEKLVYERNAGNSAWQIVPSDHRRWVYFGWLPILELKVSHATSGEETGTLIARKYTWGLDLSQSVGGAGGIGGLLASVDTLENTTTSDDRTFAYFYDGNGNVTQLLETTGGTAGPNFGTLAARYEYDPYGRPLLDDADAGVSGTYAATNTFRFSTKPVDAETSFSYFGYRYYSAMMGRWVSRDPLGVKGGPNDYSGIANSPLAFVDPDGRHPLLLILFFGLAISAIEEPAFAPTLTDDIGAINAEFQMNRARSLAAVLTMPVGGFGFRLGSTLVRTGGGRLGASQLAQIMGGSVIGSAAQNGAIDALTGDFSNFTSEFLWGAVGNAGTGVLLGPGKNVSVPGEPKCWTIEIKSNGKHAWASAYPEANSSERFNFHQTVDPDSLISVPELKSLAGRPARLGKSDISFELYHKDSEATTTSRIRATRKEAQALFSALQSRAPGFDYSTVSTPFGFGVNGTIDGGLLGPKTFTIGPCNNCVTTITQALNQSGIGSFGLTGPYGPIAISSMSGGSQLSPLLDATARGGPTAGLSIWISVQREQ